MPSTAHAAAHRPPLHSTLSPAQHHDLSLELFHRFMTYETSWNQERSPDYADPPASPDATLRSCSSPTFSATSGLPIPDPRREIRAMPTRKSQSSASTRPSAFPAVPTALPHLVADEETASSSTPSHASPKTPERLSNGAAAASNHGRAPPTDPHALSSQFQQLSVQPSHHPSSHKSPHASHHLADTSATTAAFRFPTLPSKLTDESYHYRQRAAHFILLWSQEAAPERLSAFNRRALPLVGNPSATINPTRKDADRRTILGGLPAPGATFDKSFAPTAGADTDSVDSHHHELDSDDDAQVDQDCLDFDACQAAHLGNNKKKRKSSRFSHPGPSGPALLTTSNTSTKQPVSNASLPDQASTRPASSSTDHPRRDRALSDKTNTLAHEAAPASLDHDKDSPHDELGGASSTQAQPSASPLRLPPRRSAGEHRRTLLRSRIRLRLSHAILKRRLDMLEADARAHRELSERATHAHPSTPAPPDQGASHSPERRMPPKRISKAGKRAQAIRGANTSVKPLTIAEIRARTAAAAASGSAPSNQDSSQLQASPRPQASPQRRAVSPAAERINSRDTPSKAGAPSKAEGRTSRRPSRSSAEPVPRPVEHVEQVKPGVVPPAGKFQFRMASAVSLRLREVRSQLDAATRNLFHSADGGVPAPIEAPPAVHSGTVSAPQGAQSESRQREPLAWDELPPWVQGALTYQQQQADTDARLARSSPRPAIAREAKLAPPPTSQAAPPRAEPRTTAGKTKAAAGRRNAPRKAAAEPAHQHGSGCRHGHGHGHGHGSSRAHGTGSALFTADDWICVFCEYELYYGETPLMLRACRSRKKLVQGKARAKGKGRAAGAKAASERTAATSHHDHGQSEQAGHSCCGHDHASTAGSDGYGGYGGRSGGGGHAHDERDRCDCGNSIHSSDFDDDH
ncbi:uncharacterized protein PAN0_002c1121 [Moesziomyces antarcticus]|uniref:Uncharacterized protein n=1 Tax=Pseudozyma antarctica TaxID=84753 RepID=A0A5C3FGR6_PSEA2|nr:uncharacterized protein PAN0_002c1121 [Moesziomyces antarcticus]GAK62919.1 conserved hypothetical protein [Moesziomyces antarcticus]SPO43603.1 uncharacterized protein PSANT_01288 [Moesziomyces antarcticus]